MGYKRFSLLLAARIISIMLVLGLLVLLISLPGYHAATLLVAGVLISMMFEIISFVSRTNAELSRFLDAARYADFSQRFELGNLGAGFGELGETFNDILRQFREKRTEQEEELRHIKALMEHVPAPLLSVFPDGKITLWNNAARRLFGTVHVNKLDDLKSFGDDFKNSLANAVPGERKLVSFDVETRSYQLTLASTQVIIGGTVERLISLQDIQSELDSVQLQSWQDLVRVLTHEIMNSITPIASLAKTTVDLVADTREQVSRIDIEQEKLAPVLEELSDVSDAVETVARRSDSLTDFVTSYRRLTRLPAPKRETIELNSLFDTVIKLVAADFKAANVQIAPTIEPTALTLDADPAMLEQLLINLLQNARQALSEHANPAGTDEKLVALSARLNRRGQVFIRIQDNGPGIEPEIADKIFVPFFTTKREGSGVGLALTRQIMIAHGGAATLGDGLKNAKGGFGAAFTLTF